MDKIDLELTNSLAQGTGTMYNVLQSYITISIATKGTFLVPMIPLAYFFYVVQKWFRKSSTEMQRVENITRSPIFSDFSQTLSGTSSIRAYDESERFKKNCRDAFDVNNASYQLVQVSRRESRSDELKNYDVIFNAVNIQPLLLLALFFTVRFQLARY